MGENMYEQIVVLCWAQTARRVEWLGWPRVVERAVFQVPEDLYMEGEEEEDKMTCTVPEDCRRPEAGTTALMATGHKKKWPYAYAYVVMQAL